MEAAVGRIEADLKHLLSALDGKQWKPVTGSIFQRMAHINTGLVEVSAAISDNEETHVRLAARAPHMAGAEQSLRRLSSDLAAILHSYSIVLESAAPVGATSLS